MARYNRIFAALDNGDTRLAGARRTLSIAHDNKAEVLFAHAIEPGDLEMAGIDLDEFAEKSKQSIEEGLERQLARALQDECVPSVEIKVKVGRINDVLEEAAKDFNPDLVICGVRGLSNMKYAFVGSVSTFLVRNMECDVLVVRPQAAVQDGGNPYDHE